MIDLKLAQKQPEVLAAALAQRHSALKIDDFLTLDDRRKSILAQVEALKSRRNQASAQVGALKREGKDATHMFEELGRLSDEIKELDASAQEARNAEEAWLLTVPNIPSPDVPSGRDESENMEIRKWGVPRHFDFTPHSHDELGIALGGLDFERAAKLAGSRFVVEKGWAAKMDRALANFFLDWHTQKHGYVEITPPYMVNAQTMTGTGQLPKFEDDLFKICDWSYYLIPTAEVPLTNLHSGEVLKESSLPLGYCAMTPCFRSEAGASGRDTRGLIRMHQFNKVEMVRFSHPDDSYNQLELMTRHAASLLEALELPYRIISLCTGDLGFSAAKTYDIEVWLPSQNTYREISSCSNCTDFQARRADIRFRPQNGKATFLHTLNGSGLPTGRTIAAIIENCQQKDGSIVIPKILRPYMNDLELIEPDK